MAWRRWGDKPLSEPMMVSLLAHICVTRPQWVKMYTHYKKYCTCYDSVTVVTCVKFRRDLLVQLIAIQSFRLRSGCVDIENEVTKSIRWYRDVTDDSHIGKNILLSVWKIVINDYFYFWVCGIVPRLRSCRILVQIVFRFTIRFVVPNWSEMHEANHIANQR